MVGGLWERIVAAAVDMCCIRKQSLGQNQELEVKLQILEASETHKMAPSWEQTIRAWGSFILKL